MTENIELLPEATKSLIIKIDLDWKSPEGSRKTKTRGLTVGNDCSQARNVSQRSNLVQRRQKRQ